MDNSEREKKKIFQKKLLQQMKKEIEILEFERKHLKVINLKAKTIRKLKISTRILKLGTPFLVTAGIVTGGFAYFNQLPFYSDEKKEYSNVMVEYDNLGNVRTEQQYNNELPKDVIQLRHYTKWELVGNEYVRTITSYKMEKIGFEEIVSLLENKDVKIEDILGKPISTISEVKNNITEEEVQRGAFIQCVIYSQVKDDYILVKQSTGENILFTFIYVVLIMCIEDFIAGLSANNLSEFSEYVHNIENKYPLLDADTIMKKLELKKDNYNRIMRD